MYPLEPGSFKEASFYWRRLHDDNPVYAEAVQRMGRGEHWTVPVLHNWRYPPQEADPTKPQQMRTIRFRPKRVRISYYGDEVRGIQIVADDKHVVALFNEHGHPIDWIPLTDMGLVVHNGDVRV